MNAALNEYIYMVDLETVGTKTESPIFQIGVAYRCPHKEVVATGMGVIIPDMANADPDTLAWGETQPAWKDALELAMIDGEPTVADGFMSAMRTLQASAKKLGIDATDGINSPRETKWWANPPEFDYAMLEYQLGGENCPWNFWQKRCLRTLKDVHDDKWTSRQAVSHDAEDDARNQMDILVEILTNIN